MGCGKAQQGVELMVIFATALMIFMLFYGIFAQQYGDTVKRQTQNEGIRVAGTLAEEISLAARAGDGYSRRVVFPNKLAGAMTYSMEINNVSGSVDLAATLGTNNVFNYTAPTATRDMVGESRYRSPNGFYIEIARGYAYVENHNGSVVFNQTRTMG